MATYKVEEIEGIGPVLGEKLRAAGINTVDKLLENAATKKQRQSLAEETGISEKQILKFTNMADLFRLNGVGQEYAELLEVAGVDTVPELAQRNAANLTAKMDCASKRITQGHRILKPKQVRREIFIPSLPFHIRSKLRKYSIFP
jgi:predicted flap endonuclease-1-like 5' DNA nuclease